MGEGKGEDEVVNRVEEGEFRCRVKDGCKWSIDAVTCSLRPLISSLDLFITVLARLSHPLSPVPLFPTT